MNKTITSDNIRFGFVLTLLLASVVIAVISLTADSAYAASMKPEPEATCPYDCKYTGYKIICNDWDHCDYPDSDGEYFKYICCSCTDPTDCYVPNPVFNTCRNASVCN